MISRNFHSSIGLRTKAFDIDLVSDIVLKKGVVDASSQVLGFMNDKVDYVITCLLLPATITFLKTAEKYNYWPKHVFGFNWATDDMIVKACGEAAKHYIGVNFVGAWWDDSPGIKLVREIADRYKRTDIGLTSLYINGVGVSMLFGEVFKRAGKDLTPDSLKAALETFRGFSTGGVLPPVTYTSTSHAPPEMVKFFKADVANKRLVAITRLAKTKRNEKKLKNFLENPGKEFFQRLPYQDLINMENYVQKSNILWEKFN
jgi:branched-chain amino acid transport system substrate-binding protein